MTITIIVFLISFVTVVSMILGKMFQRHVVRINFISEISSRADVVARRVLEKLTAHYVMIRKITHLFFFEFLPSYAYEILVKMKDYIARKYYVMGDQLRGRRVLRSSGSVSFFFREIGKGKANRKLSKFLKERL